MWGYTGKGTKTCKNNFKLSFLPERENFSLSFLEKIKSLASPDIKLLNEVVLYV